MEDKREKKIFNEPEIEIVKFENENMMIFTCASGNIGAPGGNISVPIGDGDFGGEFG